MSIQQRVASGIKDLRTKYRMTQEKLAELADLDISFISEVENGKRNITINTLEKIASSFNVDISCIISKDEDEKAGKDRFITSIIDILPDLDVESLESFFTLLKIYKNNQK